MLALISPLIIRGTIDNTVRGHIALHLWCSGGGEPLHIEMPGNCLQDIAGCRVQFENRQHLSNETREADVLSMLRAHKGSFTAGDITLSRRVRTGKAGAERVHNLLSIEFFVEARVRVLIECPQFRFRILPGNWRAGWEEDAVQRLLNREAMHEHVLCNVEQFRGSAITQTGPGFPPCEWDARLNRAEAYMAIMPSIHEKYRCMPGGYLSEAYVVDRPDILTMAAMEQDAGRPLPREHHWEILDFVEPEYVEDVAQAMRHPLFRTTSSVTESVHRHLIAPAGKGVSKHVAANFLGHYAGIISHILATILLTQAADYPHALASQRITNLRQRLTRLHELAAPLPTEHREPLLRAVNELMKNLQDYGSTIRL